MTDDDLKGYATVGEAMLGRTLEIEKRGGVPHYVTGQRKVKVDRTVGELPEECGIVGYTAYVDQMGKAVMLLWEKRDDGWRAVACARAGLQVFYGWADPPECFVPSEDTLRELREGEIILEMQEEMEQFARDHIVGMPVGERTLDLVRAQISAMFTARGVEGYRAVPINLRAEGAEIVWDGLEIESVE